MFESLTNGSFISNLLIPWAIRIAVAIVIIVVGWILTKLIVRLVERYLTRYEVDEILVKFIASVTRRMTSVTASHTSCGSSSIQPGCGWWRGYSR